MSGFRIEERIVADDGSDGTFWRNGERWLRERGTETRLAYIAPRQEAQHMMALTPLEEKAALWSKEISQILGAKSVNDSRAALEAAAKKWAINDDPKQYADFYEQESSSLKLLLRAICADKVDLVRFPQPLLLFYGEPRKILSFELDSSGIPVLTEEILKALEAAK